MKTITTAELHLAMMDHEKYREYLSYLEAVEEYGPGVEEEPKNQGKQLKLEDIDFAESIRQGVLKTEDFLVSLADFKNSILTRCVFPPGLELFSTDYDFAKFEETVLSDCDFSGCILHYVNFSDSVLTNCKFTSADISNAWFGNCTITGCDFTGIMITSNSGSGLSVLFSANTISNNTIGKGIIPMPDIIDRIREILTTSAECKIDMNNWHFCDTVHCLAGWITHVHPQGKELEKKYGTPLASSLILMSSGHPSIPAYFDTAMGGEVRAMNWLKTGEQKDPDE